MRQLSVLAAVPVLVLGLTVTSAAVATPTTAPGACRFAEAPGPDDLDGDGCPDLVVGAPAEDAVDVHYSAGADTGADPRAQRIHESDLVAAGGSSADQFGAASALMQLGGYGTVDDLAVGAPGFGGTGAVFIARGSANGVRTDAVVRLAGRSTGERFGSAVVADGNDVWVGAPDRSVNGQPGAGAIDHYRVDADGAVRRIETIVQGSGGVGGTPEPGDHFGALLSLAPRPSTGDVLLVGIPDEDVGSVKDAGMVTAIFFSRPATGTSATVTGSASATQNSSGIDGTAEAGDHFGGSVSLYADGAIAAVGVPGEDIGTVRDAGIVQVLRFSSHATPVDLANASQSTPTVAGTPEAGDGFGATVLLVGTTYDATGGPTQPYAHGPQVYVGVPGEDLTAAADGGMVNELLLSNDTHTLTGEGTIYRGHSLPGVPAAGDRLGAGLSGIALPDIESPSAYYDGGCAVAVAVPGDDAGATDAGSIGLLYPSVYGEPANQSSVRAVGGPRSGDRYGVGASTNDTAPRTTNDNGG